MDLHLDSNFSELTHRRGSNTYLCSKRYHVAQSAPKEQALLGIEPFWERPKLEPLLRWEGWRKNFKLAILATEGISINILQKTPPDKVTFHPEIIYEEDVDNSTAQSERDCRIWNAQLKNAWLNKCQKIQAAIILCGDKPWKICDTKDVSLTYLSLAFAWEAVGYLVLRNQPFKLIKSRQRTFGRVWITSLLSREK